MEKERPSAEDFALISDTFKQLCDANRLKIFYLLCHREECVTEIAAQLEMTSPAASHHLRQLRLADLITSRRSGKEVYYRAAGTKQAEYLHKMIEELLDLSCPSR